MKAICDKCNNEIEINKDNIIRVVNFSVDNKKINYEYFKCDNCDRAFIITVEDIYFLKLKNKMLKIKESMNKKKYVSDVRKQEYEDAKYEAISYQKKLIASLENKLPLE